MKKIVNSVNIFSINTIFARGDISMDIIRKIENEHLSVKVSDHGAELCSIFDKKNNREVIWQADPEYWKRHAPILFPNVGKQFENKYTFEGRTYETKQHGFARDTDFVCVKAEGNEIIHELKSNEETKKVYPFDFTLRVTHTLNDKTVKVTWDVINDGKGDMFFTIGAHPAFNVPVEEGTVRSDYKLLFEGKDKLEYMLINPQYGTAETAEKYEIKLDDHKCTIEDDMFDNDALVFDDTQIEKAAILMKDGSKYVEMICEGFPSFGIWSNHQSPFVCLEPWMGRCDDTGFIKDLSEKKNINKVEVKGTFNKSYTITVY